MFETFAVISTLSCVVIFVGLFMMDRAGRKEEDGRRDRHRDAPGS
jgi:hypothetical protein